MSLVWMLLPSSLCLIICIAFAIHHAVQLYNRFKKNIIIAKTLDVILAFVSRCFVLVTIPLLYIFEPRPVVMSQIIGGVLFYLFALSDWFFVGGETARYRMIKFQMFDPTNTPGIVAATVGSICMIGVIALVGIGRIASETYVASLLIVHGVMSTFLYIQFMLMIREYAILVAVETIKNIFFDVVRRFFPMSLHFASHVTGIGVGIFMVMSGRDEGFIGKLSVFWNVLLPVHMTVSFITCVMYFVRNRRKLERGTLCFRVRAVYLLWCWDLLEKHHVDELPSSFKAKSTSVTDFVGTGRVVRGKSESDARPVDTLSSI